MFLIKQIPHIQCFIVDGHLGFAKKQSKKPFNKYCKKFNLEEKKSEKAISKMQNFANPRYALTL